jgi:hypothetical protein
MAAVGGAQGAARRESPLIKWTGPQSRDVAVQGCCACDLGMMDCDFGVGGRNKR